MRKLLIALGVVGLFVLAQGCVHVGRGHHGHHGHHR